MSRLHRLLNLPSGGSRPPSVPLETYLDPGEEWAPQRTEAAARDLLNLWQGARSPDFATNRLFNRVYRTGGRPALSGNRRSGRRPSVRKGAEP